MVKPNFIYLSFSLLHSMYVQNYLYFKRLLCKMIVLITW